MSFFPICTVGLGPGVSELAYDLGSDLNNAIIATHASDTGSFDISSLGPQAAQLTITNPLAVPITVLIAVEFPAVQVYDGAFAGTAFEVQRFYTFYDGVTTFSAGQQQSPGVSINGAPLSVTMEAYSQTFVRSLAASASINVELNDQMYITTQGSVGNTYDISLNGANTNWSIFATGWETA